MRIEDACLPAGREDGEWKSEVGDQRTDVGGHITRQLILEAADVKCVGTVGRVYRNARIY